MQEDRLLVCAMSNLTYPLDWEEIDRLDAFGTFGGRIIPYNGTWKIMLSETNCELWSFPTEHLAKLKYEEAVRRSGYKESENPLYQLELAKQVLAQLASLLLQTQTPIGPMRDRKDYPIELQNAILFNFGNYDKIKLIPDDPKL